MIPVEELRWGNWVQTGDGTYATIGQMDYEQWTFDRLEPIPLTHDLLKKCGFDKGWLIVNGDNIHMNLHTGAVALSGPEACIDGHAFWVHHVKYLHQLQNLIFALTGTELQINDL